MGFVKVSGTGWQGVFPLGTKTLNYLLLAVFYLDLSPGCLSKSHYNREKLVLIGERKKEVCARNEDQSM